MKTRLVLLLLIAGLAGMAARNIDAANVIYRWTDENGAVVFGDTPPKGVEAVPVNVRPNTVQSVQPKRPMAEPDPSDGESASDGESGEPPMSLAEQRRQERAQSRQAAAEETRITEANCNTMRQQKAAVEPSTRVMVDDGEGGSRRLEDNERLQLLNEADAYLAENCNG